MKNIKFGLIAASAVCAVIVLSISPACAGESFPGGEGTAGAVVEGLPPSGAPYTVFVVPGAAFAHDGFDGGDDYYFFSFSGGAIQGDAGAGCVRAPVLVPDDAEAGEFWASVYDNDAADFVWVDFWQEATYSGVNTKITRVETSADSTSIQSKGDMTISVDLNYPSYSYYATTCLNNANQRLYSVRVWYAPEWIFSDGFGRGSAVRWTDAVY